MFWPVPPVMVDCPMMLANSILSSCNVDPVGNDLRSMTKASDWVAPPVAAVPVMTIGVSMLVDVVVGIIVRTSSVVVAES